MFFNFYSIYFYLFFGLLLFFSIFVSNFVTDFLSNIFHFCGKNFIIFNYPVTSNMEKIISLHHTIMWFIIAIMVLVLWLILSFYMSYVYSTKDISFLDVSKNEKFFDNENLINKKVGSSIKNKNIIEILEFLRMALTIQILKNRKFVEQKYLESAWTLIPCYILINIAIPSFNILYLNEEIINPDLTVNIIAHQWYWSIDLKDLHFGFLMKNNTSSNFNLYENNIDSFLFDSYMEPEDYLDKVSGDFRLLETEEPFILPSNVNLRIIISSFDTLHSFTVPSIGLKVDAVPGRLNELGCLLKNSGVFYGQCSEICGIGHAFMPITLFSVPRLNFLLGTNIC